MNVGKIHFQLITIIVRENTNHIKMQENITNI